MTLNERGMSVTNIPYGDFTSPETLDIRGLEHLIPKYLGSFSMWANERRLDMLEKAAGQTRAFDYYLETAFRRAIELGLRDNPLFKNWRARYEAERETAMMILYPSPST